MELNGQELIGADQEVVWILLNDPGVLIRCIPGCETLESDGDNKFIATVALKVGPVKARFKGSVELQDRVRPQSYRIVGEGSGGIAGFAKGRADVMLTSDGNATLLDYAVEAQVGGKIAALGSRLIASTSTKLARQFFEKFNDIASNHKHSRVA